MRSIIEVKEYIAKKIEEHEAEIEMLRRNLELLDSALTKSSFAKASDLLRGGAAGGAAAASRAGPAGDAGRAGNDGDGSGGGAAGDGGGGAAGGKQDEPGAGARGQGPEPVVISAGDGQVLARAYVTDDAVSVVVADGISIDASASHIQESIMDKLVGRMKREDAADVEGGSLGQGESVAASVEADGDRLLSITVRNYRKKNRAGEIIGMAKWAINELAAAGR